MKSVTSFFKLIGVSVKCGIALIGAAVLGGLLVVAAQWVDARLRPSQGGTLDLIPVKLEDIAEQHQWLLNYNVFFVPIKNANEDFSDNPAIRSDSSYALLVVMPKQDKAIVSPPPGKHVFTLSWYASNSVMPITINGSYLAQNPDKPEIILLDFIDSYGDLGGKALVLKTDPFWLNNHKSGSPD
jgi:hypothetical protein